MYGTQAVLILVGFLAVAVLLFGGIVAEWKAKPKGQRAGLKLIGVTVFLVSWFCMIFTHYVNEVQFHYQLRHLQASGIYSVQIGKHDFRDRAAIQEIVGAVRQSRWFEANHGGWGDSVQPGHIANLPIWIQFFSGDEDNFAAGARERSGSTNSQAVAPSTDKPAATKKDVVHPNREARKGVNDAVSAPPS